MSADFRGGRKGRKRYCLSCGWLRGELKKKGKESKNGYPPSATAASIEEKKKKEGGEKELARSPTDSVLLKSVQIRGERNKRWFCGEGRQPQNSTFLS